MSAARGLSWARLALLVHHAAPQAAIARAALGARHVAPVANQPVHAR